MPNSSATTGPGRSCWPGSGRRAWPRPRGSRGGLPSRSIGTSPGSTPSCPPRSTRSCMRDPSSGWKPAGAAVEWLVRAVDPSGPVRVRVLDVSWRELCRDLERAIEFDQSAIFRKVYEDEFGVAGGEPFGLLVGDYEVRHRPGPGHPTDRRGGAHGDVPRRGRGVSRRSWWAAPRRCWGLDGFVDLTVPIELESTFRSAEYARWRSFRETEDSRFVGIVLPRILMRSPLARRRRPSPPASDMPRMSPPPTQVVISGATPPSRSPGWVARAFERTGWLADIRGARRGRRRRRAGRRPAGAVVRDRPAGRRLALRHRRRRARAPGTGADRSRLHRPVRCPRDPLGRVPLQCLGAPAEALRYGRRDRQRAAVGAAPVHASASAASPIWSRCCSATKVGSFATPQECERYLRERLYHYCETKITATVEEKARRPLRDADVEVREVPGKPGHYACTCHLEPHFQLDQVRSSFHLEIDAGGRGRDRR